MDCCLRGVISVKKEDLSEKLPKVIEMSFKKTLSLYTTKKFENNIKLNVKKEVSDNINIAKNNFNKTYNISCNSHEKI